MEDSGSSYWKEGRNIKEERSMKEKSKRHKIKSIQEGINDYLKHSNEINPDEEKFNNSDIFDDDSYH